MSQTTCALGELRPKTTVSALLAALLVTVLTTGSVLGNGGTVQVSNAQAGPYRVSIFTNPNPIRTGTVDVSVLVQTPGSTEVVQDVVVMVTADPVGGNATGQNFEATHEQATNKLYYAANVVLPTEGRWKIEAIIVGPLGDGNVSFEVNATRESLTDRPLYLLGIVIIPVVGVVAWLVLGGRNRGVGRKVDVDDHER